MQSGQWQWQAGAVDLQKAHIELRHGDAEHDPYEAWRPIARIGEPHGGIFTVEWLLTPDSPEAQPIMAAARRELDFFLVEAGYEDPWAYAIYHCNTASNMYSRVHWSYFPEGNEGPHRASKVVRLSDGGLGIVKRND
jgi:hypothetical protein